MCVCIYIVCEIPPLKDAVQNNEKNELINDINELNDYSGDNSSVKILSLTANIKGANINQSDEHRDNKGGYNHLYFDNVHLSHCSICPQGLYQNKTIGAKAPVVRFKQNYRYEPFNAKKNNHLSFQLR